QEASFDGVILMPYFLSNSITEAITTDEQSVSGMKPIFTSFFSGASEPAAHAPTRTASGTRLMSALAPAAFRNCRFLIAFPFELQLPTCACFASRMPVLSPGDARLFSFDSHFDGARVHDDAQPSVNGMR